MNGTLWRMKRRNQNKEISFQIIFRWRGLGRSRQKIERRFLCFGYRPEGGGEARRITMHPNAYAKVQSHHALRALQINRFAIVQNRFVQRLKSLRRMILPLPKGVRRVAPQAQQQNGQNEWEKNQRFFAVWRQSRWELKRKSAGICFLFCI